MLIDRSEPAHLQNTLQQPGTRQTFASPCRPACCQLVSCYRCYTYAACQESNAAYAQLDPFTPATHTLQRRREERDAQQQQLAQRLQALERTTARAAGAESELRRSTLRMSCPIEGAVAACKVAK